jgi:multidrug efflux pump subunit AcrA (membrane-fusion protein)
MKRLRFWIVILPLLGLGALGVRLLMTRRVQAKADLPSAIARKGEFQVKVRCRGDLIAARSVQLTAPMNVPGMQIAWQAAPNSEVKEGDPVVRFDSSVLRQTLLENKAVLGSAEATLDQYMAQAKITAEQDQLDLTSARVEVEKARLEASKQEVVSRIQGEESKIDLSLAEEKLKVQAAAISLHESSSAQKINSGKRLRDKAQADIDLANHRLEMMEMKAPSNGVVVYLPNYSQGWINAKPFKVGDQVWPGSVIAELPDLSTLEMKAKLEETDRGSRFGGARSARAGGPVPGKAVPIQSGIALAAGGAGFRMASDAQFHGAGPFDRTGCTAAPGDERASGYRGGPYSGRDQRALRRGVHAPRTPHRLRGHKERLGGEGGRDSG